MREIAKSCLKYLRTSASIVENAYMGNTYIQPFEKLEFYINENARKKCLCAYDLSIESYNRIRQEDISSIDLSEAYRCLLFIVRSERFCGYSIKDAADEGLLQALLERYLKLTATSREAIASGVFGMAVADAVGVPAEFRSRRELKQQPIVDMVGGGAHRQIAGTWSDDTSMALCLAFSMAKKRSIDADDIMRRFCDWRNNGAYSPHNECFDIGGTVSKALWRYDSGVPAQKCGGNGVQDNGNGSLMRILPVVYLLMSKYSNGISQNDDAMKSIDIISSLTHAHAISLVACGIYILIAERLLLGDTVIDAIRNGTNNAMRWYSSHSGYENGLGCWKRILDISAFMALPESEIKSGGYVVDTLEAALWCILNTDNYHDCVLKAVNLGEDTDTTSAVAGGLAGIRYGLAGIPQNWLDGLQNKEMLNSCCDALSALM